MLTIEPVRRGFIRRTASLEPWMTAWRLSSSWRSAVASVSSSNGPIGMMPALLTTMSIGPSRPSMSSSAAVNAGRSVTSSASPIAPPPTSPAACSAVAPSRSAIATRTPSRASPAEMALPMPRPPPVTTATFPVRERGCLAMDSCSSSGSDAVSGGKPYRLQVRAAREVGPEAPDLAAHEHRAVDPEYEPCVEHGRDRPRLERGDPLHRRLRAGLALGERGTEELGGGLVVERGEHAHAAAVDHGVAPVGDQQPRTPTQHRVEVLAVGHPSERAIDPPD